MTWSWFSFLFCATTRSELAKTPSNIKNRHHLTILCIKKIPAFMNIKLQVSTLKPLNSVQLWITTSGTLLVVGCGFVVCSDQNSSLFKGHLFPPSPQNKHTHTSSLTLWHSLLQLLSKYSPLNGAKTSVHNCSLCTLGDPQVVPVSGLCLPPGGHLHQRSSALRLLDSRKGKLLFLFPSHSVRQRSWGERGDYPWWLTL